MATDLTCGKCGRYFQVASLDAGSILECPACGTIHEPVTPPTPPDADPSPEDDLGQRRDLAPHRGQLVMVLGIVSLVMIGFIAPLGIPFGIAAWIMGHGDLKKIKKKEMDPEGESKTNAGRICGMVGTIISAAISLFICVFYGLLFGMIFTVGPGPGPRPPKLAPMRPMPPPPPIENVPLEKENPPNP